jgi:putative thioredoxin
VTVDEAHDVERGTVDGEVVAEPLDRRHRNGGALQGGEDPMFAPHVVGAREDVAERRTPQHESRSGGAGDPEGQVGVAAGDHVESERADGAVDVGLQPCRDRADVDSGYVVHVGDLLRIQSCASRVLRQRSRSPSCKAGSVEAMAAIDVTDATFQTEVIDKSQEVAVVVDLWAPWCGPCKTLGPIIEKVIDATDGKVVLAKVNVDENPGIAQAFQAQSIPAVYALKDGAVVDGFIGAYPEHEVQRFVDSLQPTEEQVAVKELIEAGDEASLRLALSMEPANEDAIVALAELLIADGNSDEALALLGRIPESDRTRHVAALARVGQAPQDDYDEQLTALLDQVKTDDEARQKYVDLLELMGPHDPRTAEYRRQLTSRLY